MAGTIVVDRIESDASYASSINIASPVVISNTTTFRSNSTISTTAAESLRLHRSGSSSQISSLVMEDGGSSVGTANTVRLSTSLGALSISTGGTGGSSTGGTEYARVEANGVFNLVSGQLKFPATQVASSDPNTLDDYEEGTWTPNDQSGAGLGNFTQVTTAVYRKVGSLVFVAFYIQFPSTANSNMAYIGGLPFECINGYFYMPARNGALTGGTVKLQIDANSTFMRPYNAESIPTNAQLSNNYFIASGFYIAAS